MRGGERGGTISSKRLVQVRLQYKGKEKGTMLIRKTRGRWGRLIAILTDGSCELVVDRSLGK